jgi:20S proteasome subunit beta 2
MTVFEAQWKPNLTVCEIVLRPRSQLTRHQSERKPSISCIFNDLGSGSNVDACVIIATKTDMLRNFVKPNKRVTKERTDDFCRGTTAFTKEEIRNLVVHKEIIGVCDDAMDVDGS